MSSPEDILNLKEIGLEMAVVRANQAQMDARAASETSKRDGVSQVQLDDQALKLQRRPSRFSVGSLRRPNLIRRQSTPPLVNSNASDGSDSSTSEQRKPSRFLVTQLSSDLPPAVPPSSSSPPPNIKVIPATPRLELPGPFMKDSHFQLHASTSAAVAAEQMSPAILALSIPHRSPTTLACVRPHILAEKLAEQLPFPTVDRKPAPHTIAKSKPVLPSGVTLSESEPHGNGFVEPAVVVSQRGRFTVIREHSTHWRPRQTLTRESRFTVVRDDHDTSQKKDSTPIGD
ncbi:hypothetical protein SpCBS45565_g01916 [Spizellomyces sp. 'palustris']|nr:hypothetical protein SpCBS45565_g01916 [Spizellomyces sp. 'palustris']